MARPREFDLEEALDRAMDLFWLQGYHATTTRDLDARLGIGHQSLYNAFGDKASLFQSVLRHYVLRVLGPRLQTIEQTGASKRDIVRFLAQMVDFFDTGPPRKGCLLMGIAMEQIHEDQIVAEIVADFLKRVESSLGDAIDEAVAKGEIEERIDKRAINNSLLCTVLGMAVAARSGMERDRMVDMASMALRPLY